MLMNWNYLDRVLGSAKYFSLFFILFIILLNLILGFSNPVIDNFGHLGGLFCGFFLFFLFHSPNEAGDGMCCSSVYWFWISIGFTVLMYGLGLILFYTVRIIK